MNEYQSRIIQGRKDFLNLTLKQEKEILKIYTEASKQISYKLSKAKAGGITARYLTELDKAISSYIMELSSNISKSLKDGIEASSQIASSVQLSYFDMLDPREDVKSTFNKMFVLLPKDITKQLISTKYYADGKTLDKRLWDLTRSNAKAIDNIIKVNVSIGANARDLAKQIDAYINPEKKLKSIPIYTINEKGNKIKLPLPDRISYNVSYQARRLARTSLTHSNNETYIQGSKMNPFCSGLKWNLSPAHSERMHGRTDICDEYATQDAYGLGSGVFPADKFPIEHPNGLCYSTQEVMDVEKSRKELIDWVNGADNSRLDKWLQDYGQEYGLNI